MHTFSLQHKISRAIPVLSAAVLLAACCIGTSSAAVTSSSRYLSPQHTSAKPKPHHVSSSLAGKWSGKYSGAFAGTFTLHWTKSGSKLSGSIALSKPSGTYSINGSVHGKTIAFGAVGAGATYTGSVSGTSMAGHYKTPQGGGHWSAHKIS